MTVVNTGRLDGKYDATVIPRCIARDSLNNVSRLWYANDVMYILLPW